MKVKNERILKNGAVAGYVYYESEKKWKWRIIKGPLKGGRKKKKFKGTKVNPLNYIRNTYNEVRQEREDSDNFQLSNNEENYLREYNEHLNHENFNEENFNEEKYSPKTQRTLRNYRNTTYEESKNEKIDDVKIFYIKLFGRKFILLGEYHENRHSENLINYSNLIKLPIKLSKKNKRCIDVYVENQIHDKPILNNNEYNIVEYKIRKNNSSLVKLIRNLTNKEKYQKHKYYRLHNFDTREETEKKNNKTYMTDIWNLFYDMDTDNYNFDNFLREIFVKKTKREIGKSIYNLLISYTNYIEKSNKSKYGNMKNAEHVDDYIGRKYRIKLGYMTNYFYNLVSRIYKEYNKIPNKFKKIDISPLNLLRVLKYKYNFMTDMYLFYRLLMNFNKDKRNTGGCKNYSEINFIMGGENHIVNIFALLNHYYGDFFEDIKIFEKMSINEYQTFLENNIFN
jgi:hypothetical protein